MTVSLVVSKTISGTQVADSLAGSSTGLDFGDAVNAEYAPITNKSANTGWQDIYIRHDAVTDPITDVGFFIALYSGTYGGANSAASDLATLIAQGTASDTSANNATGNGQGLRIEMGADLGNTLGANAFDATRAQVKIFGDNGTDGISLASKFNLHVDAMIYHAATHGTPTGSPVVATTPVTGQIGKDGDTVLGDHALVKFRYYLNDAATEGGILQADLTITYSFTA